MRVYGGAWDEEACGDGGGRGRGAARKNTVGGVVKRGKDGKRWGRTDGETGEGRIGREVKEREGR